jgi:hypothetical protein
MLVNPIPWLKEDRALLEMLAIVCPFDSYLDDHKPYTTKEETFDTIVIVQRYVEGDEGWERQPRMQKVDFQGETGAWICPFHKGDFCKNPLYLGQDGKLHLSTAARGSDFISKEMIGNFLWQDISWAKMTRRRELNIVISLADARKLLTNCELFVTKLRAEGALIA